MMSEFGLNSDAMSATTVYAVLIITLCARTTRLLAPAEAIDANVMVCQIILV